MLSKLIEKYEFILKYLDIVGLTFCTLRSNIIVFVISNSKLPVGTRQYYADQLLLHSVTTRRLT